MVGARGFEPPTLCSQSRCATRLRYAPTKLAILPGDFPRVGFSLGQSPADMLLQQRSGMRECALQCLDSCLAPGRLVIASKAVAQGNGEVALPALEADAANRAALGALLELRFAPIPQVEQLGLVKTVAGIEIGQGAALGITIPGADQLAVVASVDAVADQRTQFQGNRPCVFDGQVGNAAPRVELFRAKNGLRRADVDAFAAGAAVGTCGGIYREGQTDEYFSQKKHRSAIALQQQGVFAAPAEPGACRQLHFQHGGGVGEHAHHARGDLGGDVIGQLLQLAPEHLVIVASSGIDGDRGRFGLRQPLPFRIAPVGRACAREIVQAGSDDA